MSDAPLPLQVSLESLQTRTLRTWKRAHVLQLSDGTRLSLDFNISAPDDATLIASIRDIASAMTGDTILPSAPEELWMRFVNVGDDEKDRRLFQIANVPGNRYNKVPAVVRIEHGTNLD